MCLGGLGLGLFFDFFSSAISSFILAVLLECLVYLCLVFVFVVYFHPCVIVSFFVD